MERSQSAGGGTRPDQLHRPTHGQHRRGQGEWTAQHAASIGRDPPEGHVTHTAQRSCRGIIRTLSWQEDPISIPDALALVRVLLVPVIMWLISANEQIEHGFGIAAVLFFVAALTDFLDGYFARRWGITTVLGAFLDTTADKFLVTGSLLALIAVGRASIWVTLIIVLREFVVMALRGLAAMSGTMVKPSIWGKLKASIQFLAILLAILRLPEPWGRLYLDEWVMWLAAIVTIASGWQYVASFWSVVRSVDTRTS
jgi:CDP-diacylglycerol---glycerol-3-phosphate 3-phosphatidyltransferase